MGGLVFETNAPAVASTPERADIACFVGFVRARDPGSSPPADLQTWFDEQGWTALRPAGAAALLDVPIPIESFAVFDRLFAWERRSLTDPGPPAAAYLGAAVRSFFAQGGRKCYVVRVGDPWPIRALRSLRLQAIDEILGASVAPGDRATWQGVTHLFGLPDVSFLCVPDLADAVAVDAAGPLDVTPAPPPATVEVFVPCDGPAAPPPPDRPLSTLLAPRCDDAGYAAWAGALRAVIDLVRSRLLRDVELVAAVPLPHRDTAAAEDAIYPYLVASGHLSDPSAAAPPVPAGLESAFVQLAYPWVRTSASAGLPEGLEGPDGVLTGVLARNALLRGTYHSAANLGLAGVLDVLPSLTQRQLSTRPNGAADDAPGLIDRVSLLGPTPSGFKLLSDVTTSAISAHRPASTSRLISAIVRAARRVGEDTVFEPSGEVTWANLRRRMTRVLRVLWRAGALRGDTEDEAFSIRCDRTTMSQADLDAGRIVVEIEIDPAPAIERIRVVLTMSSGGDVSLAKEAP